MGSGTLQQKEQEGTWTVWGEGPSAVMGTLLEAVLVPPVSNMLKKLPFPALLEQINVLFPSHFLT